MFNTHNMKFDSNPFDHWVIDNFLDSVDAENLSKEFINYDSSQDVVHYQGWIAEKKTCNVWNRFPPLTYKTFSNLLSLDFVTHLSAITGITPLYPDIGLHGGGWHMHKAGGNLALHLDYSIHPKTQLQRKLNLIVYLEEEYKPEWGGGLEFWSHDEENNRPLEKVKVIEPVFNRAVLFDTTQNSWHGFPQPITCPEGKMRKSFAVYYMTDITSTAVERYKAHYVQL
tara:strand:- start:1518 stop:2195 length:678 start_codon:yes stop_codon:yes gene_type:complete